MQLFGRIEVERLACDGVGLLFELHQLGAEFRALTGEFSAVDLHAVAFHFKQYLCNGQLHFFIHFKLFWRPFARAGTLRGVGQNRRLVRRIRSPAR